jgi:hypothetical protein
VATDSRTEAPEKTREDQIHKQKLLCLLARLAFILKSTWYEDCASDSDLLLAADHHPHVLCPIAGCICVHVMSAVTLAQITSARRALSSQR